MSIEEANSLHEKAMDLAELAVASRIHGNYTDSLTYFKDALEVGLGAIDLARTTIEEPARSILHRSVASVALNCGEFRTAERIVASGLEGDAPEFMLDELRDVLEQIYFERHLSLRGIALDPDSELQLVIAGRGVGFGMAFSHDFTPRLAHLEKLIYRTAERHLKIPYREAGPPSKKIKDRFSVLISPPRAASFAISLRIGRTVGQQSFEFDLSTSQLIDSIMNDIELFSNGDWDTLNKSIPDEVYRNNFFALARSIAPRGKDISLVGLTYRRGSEERHVAIRSVQEQAPWPMQLLISEVEDQTVTIVGLLRQADLTKTAFGQISIVDDNNVIHDIHVPKGLMGDIVRPLWDSRVQMMGLQRQTYIELIDIVPAE